MQISDGASGTDAAADATTVSRMEVEQKLRETTTFFLIGERINDLDVRIDQLFEEDNILMERNRVFNIMNDMT